MTNCLLCGEPLPPSKRRPRIYCDATCRRIYYKRKNGSTIGDVKECEVCEKPFVTKSNNARYCSRRCRDIKNGNITGRIGSEIECICCRKTIIREAVNQIICNHKCEPAGKIECISCKEPLDYHEFRDYRGQHDGGKLRRKCKGCEKKWRQQKMEKEK